MPEIVNRADGDDKPGSLKYALDNVSCDDEIIIELEDNSSRFEYESLSINKNIKIVGNRCQFSIRKLIFEGCNNVSFIDIVFQNSINILSNDDLSLNIEKCDFSMSESSCISIEHISELYLSKCSFHDNFGYSCISLNRMNSSNVKITECNFESCNTSYILALSLNDNQKIELDISELSIELMIDPIFYASSTGLFIHLGENSICDCKIDSTDFIGVEDNNDCITNNGIILLGSGYMNMVVSNCEFNNLLSQSEGSAIYSNMEYNSINNYDISKCIFNNNSAISGGAIYINANGQIKIDDCDFDSNFSVQESSAVYLNNNNTSDSHLLLINSRFSNNVSTSSTVQATTLSINNYKTLIDNVIFDHNSGFHNCAIYAYVSDTMPFVMKNSSIVRNKTEDGIAGIYIKGDEGALVDIYNSTISNNISNNAYGFIGGIFIGSENRILASIINCTITGNKGIGFVSENNLSPSENNSDITICNCIIANNTPYDVYSTNLGTGTVSNNLITKNEGIPNSICGNNNKIGTEEDPIDPMLDQLEKINDNTYIVPLLLGSPAINAGDSSFVPDDILYDQRGETFPRIVNNSVDIGAFECQDVPELYIDCESMVMIREIQTGIIKQIPINQVFFGIHQVFDITNKKFIDVRSNVVTNSPNQLILLEKNALAPGKPNRNIKLIDDQEILINGTEIKASDITQSKKIRSDITYIYSICTDYKTSIRINGLDIFTQNIDEWEQYSDDNCIPWIENRPDI